jgi:UDP-N-acetyl-2-amino-2-deoxyglucuronate dehydrogenase
MKNFALIGAAGYIAPRHMKAIKETGNNLVAALDKFDSVGVIDQYFPKADFFTEFERFDRHLEKLKRSGTKIDYLSICSPNYLHDAHIRFGLRYGAHVICEKPMVLNPWNVAALKEMLSTTDRKIFNILQLRLHPNVLALRKKVQEAKKGTHFDIDLTYITSRGNWYYSSWKGDETKSGGISTNIGIHFFDLLAWIFGEVENNKVHIHTHDRAAGLLELKNARVRWFLSINSKTLPPEISKSGKTTYRSLKIDGEDFDFSDGFADLHTESYKQILNGKGFNLTDVRSAIEIAHDIRSQNPMGLTGDHHPLAGIELNKHPFES